MCRSSKGPSLAGLAARYETVLLLAFLTLLFSLLSDHFFTLLNFRNMLLQNTHMFVIVAGLAAVMIGGGIDFSVGYQISLVSAVIGLVLSSGGSLFPALAAGMVTGLLCGILNGMLVARFQFAPFVATFITQMIFQGISYWISGGRTYTSIPAAFRGLTEWSLLGIPFDAFWAILCFLLIAFLFRYTFFGRQVRALGENAGLAERAGIRVRSLQFACYVFAGLLYSLAAMILISRQSMASSANGVGTEIMAISAMLIGRCNIRFSGMRVTNVHTVDIFLGLLVCIVVENGMLQLGATQYVQYLCIGLLAVFVLLDGRRRQDRQNSV